MRNLMLAAAVALSAIACAAPSHAGSDEERHETPPECFDKKLIGYDNYGKLVIKYVRVCR